MADELRRQSHSYGGQDLSVNAPDLQRQVMQQIERLPEALRTHLMQGFTGDLLILSLKVQEIQATNIEFQVHLREISNLLSKVKQDGNRGYVTTTSKGPGGETHIEISTGGTPVIRPVGGGCSTAVVFFVATGSIFAWWALS